MGGLFDITKNQLDHPLGWFFNVQNSRLDKWCSYLLTHEKWVGATNMGEKHMARTGRYYFDLQPTSCRIIDDRDLKVPSRHDWRDVAGIKKRLGNRRKKPLPPAIRAAMELQLRVITNPSRKVKLAFP